MTSPNGEEPGQLFDQAPSRLHAHTYVSTEDGPEVDYWVSEMMPGPNEQNKPNEDDNFLRPSTIEEDEIDTREVTLDLDLETFEVHHVEAVKFATTSHIVRRHRWEKKDLDF